MEHFIIIVATKIIGNLSRNRLTYHRNTNVSCYPDIFIIWHVVSSRDLY